DETTSGHSGDRTRGMTRTREARGTSGRRARHRATAPRSRRGGEQQETFSTPKEQQREYGNQRTRPRNQKTSRSDRCRQQQKALFFFCCRQGMSRGMQERGKEWRLIR